MRAQSLPPIRSTLRVKSQFQSLRTRGLHRVSNVHKTVEFAFLEVREFPMILGDNPSCVEGPPVTIDWGFDPDTHFILDVATFERMRGRRRNTCDLVVPKHVRERWYVRRNITVGHDPFCTVRVQSACDTLFRDYFPTTNPLRLLSF